MSNNRNLYKRTTIEKCLLLDTQKFLIIGTVSNNGDLFLIMDTFLGIIWQVNINVRLILPREAYLNYFGYIAKMVGYPNPVRI